MRYPDIPTDRVAKWAIGNTLPNLIFFGVGLLIILLIGSKWTIIGKIGFWIYFVLTALEALRLTVLYGTTIILFFTPKEERNPQAWTWFSILIQTIEFGLFLVYALVLYRRFA